MNSFIKNSIRFALFLLVQVVVLKEVPPIHQYITPYLYFIFILWMPFGTSRLSITLLGFLIGFIFPIGRTFFNPSATMLSPMFKPETTSLPIYFKDKGVFKNAPLGSDGKVEATIHGKIREFLTDREHNLEDFAPKKLEDAQQGKINEIIGFLTGKSTQNFVSSKPESKPTSAPCA